MARRGKIKYKDVVKKVGVNYSKKNHKKAGTKKPKQRKTYSLYKTDNKRKLPESEQVSEDVIAKKTKIDDKIQKQYESSSSEDDTNELSNLINTFKGNIKTTVAVESSSDSDTNEEGEDNNFEKDDDNVDSVESETEESSFSENESVSLEDHVENIDDNKTIENELVQTEETEIDLEINSEEETENNEDPFSKHFFYDIHESLLEILQSTNNVITCKESWPQIGNLFLQIPKVEKVLSNDNLSFGLLEKKTFATEGAIPKRNGRSKTPEELFIKSQIIPNIINANSINSGDTFSPFQAELFSIINNYQDLYFPQTTFSNLEEIRFTYCLHAVNHILKTRLKVIHHNAKLKLKEEVPDEFRDQGLVRPKVIIGI